MQVGFLKGLKPLLIQRIAMFMAICYLLNPLHQQITLVLHEISHSLEIPDYVMSHNTNSHHEYETHDYSMDEIEHDHNLIDLLASVLEASNDKDDSENSNVVKVKIDKHISKFQIDLQNHFSDKSQHSFSIIQENMKPGYLGKMEKPPQLPLG